MDGRIALAPGSVLKLRTGTGYTPYTVNREVGRGGSSIVYDASYADSLGNFKLVRIKECYPHALRLSRNAEGALQADPRDAEAFSAARVRMKAAYQRNHDLFSVGTLTNFVSNTSDIHETNGTVYIVSVYVNGRTFADFQGETLHDCIALVLSTAGVLKRIHDAGCLYLDLKPDNILTLDGSLDLVQLFDFDSMISSEELAAAIQANDPDALRASYTKGYAPLEQQTGKLRRLGKHSDLYSLGAVLFYALWHRTPTAFDCDPAAVFDYGGTVYAGESHQDALYPALSIFFRKTLASYHSDRYQDAAEAIAQLRTVLSLADETKPWIRSSPIRENTAFFGRDSEISALSNLLRQSGRPTVSLYGLGGIGKSTLVRQYCAACARDWDTVLWLYDRGSLQDLIADDALVKVSTVRRIREESTDEYVRRKLAVISELAEKQRILLILDNFEAGHLDQLAPLQSVGWTILLISRKQLPEGLYPSLRLQEMDGGDLIRLFMHYAHCDEIGEPDVSAIRTILSRISGHTLLTELIARQVAKSHLDVQAAEAMVAGAGLSSLPPEQIDYVRDQTSIRAALPAVLDRLAETDRFTERERITLSLLSLFDSPGIDAELFKALTEMETLDFINDLEQSGWVSSDGKQIGMHPLLQEHIRTWAWTEDRKAAADRMMRNLYERIRPAGTRHDGSRQYPEDYGRFYQLIRIIPQITDRIGYVSEASERLLFRWLMDAPIDQDAPVLFRMLDLLADARYLDSVSILRLYETAAYLRARLYDPEAATELLKEMRRYLRIHPSNFYLSAYHCARAVILHNANGDLAKTLRHEDRAIAAARLSGHPDAKKQLASCLLNKARTLMSAETGRKQVRRLIREAEPLILRFTEPLDYERYQYCCNAAMCSAADGEIAAAQGMLDAADAIAFASPDSDLAVAEHLIEEHAPIRIAMGQYDLAEDAVLQAIQLCVRHPEALRYRETVFDAYFFLGRIYTMDKQYGKAKEAYDAAELRVKDSPYVWKLPLCPKDVLELAGSEEARSAPSS